MAGPPRSSLTGATANDQEQGVRAGIPGGVRAGIPELGVPPRIGALLLTRPVEVSRERKGLREVI